MAIEIKFYKVIKSLNDSYKVDLSGNTIRSNKYLLIYLLPCICVIFFLWQKIYLYKDIAMFVVTGVGVFSGLLFSVLFIAPDKFEKRKRALSSQKDDQSIRFMMRYMNFSTRFVTQISYMLYLAIIIVIGASILVFIPVEKGTLLNIIFVILNCITLFLISHFIINIFIVISSVYSMMISDIEFWNKFYDENSKKKDNL